MDQWIILSLLVTSIATLLGFSRVAMAMMGVTAGLGLISARITPLGLSLFTLFMLAAWVAANSQRRWLQHVSAAVVLVLAAFLAMHLMPGFSNILLLSDVQFSADSAPFTMYANLDKTLAGVAILLILVKPEQVGRLRFSDMKMILATTAALIVLLAILGLGIGYIRFDPKWSEEYGWLWTINNLLLVCVAEEALFRGFIQRQLGQLLPVSRRRDVIAISIAALLFGLAHWKGGVAYVALASIAGVIYGVNYQNTKKIEAAILTHFLVNITHFCLFSYPALMSVS